VIPGLLCVWVNCSVLLALSRVARSLGAPTLILCRRSDCLVHSDDAQLVAEDGQLL